MAEPESNAVRLEFFKGNDDQWYWHVKSRNNKVVADGGEGYTRESDAKEAAAKVFPSLVDESKDVEAPEVEEEPTEPTDTTEGDA